MLKPSGGYIRKLALMAALAASAAGCSQTTPDSASKTRPAKTKSTLQSNQSMTDSNPESTHRANKQKVTPPSAASEITVVELKAALENNEDFILLDVRTEEEYQQAHVKGAYALIPHQEVLSRLDELPEDKETYIYSFCRSGRRSALVTNQLRDAGYVHAYNVVGGILAWGGAGFPLERK